MNIVLGDLDLNFQGQKFQNLSISETVRACVKMRADFYNGWYLPLNGIMVNVVLGNLDLNFKLLLINYIIKFVDIRNLSILYLSSECKEQLNLKSVSNVGS